MGPSPSPVTSASTWVTGSSSRAARPRRGGPRDPPYRLTPRTSSNEPRTRRVTPPRFLTSDLLEGGHRDQGRPYRMIDAVAADVSPNTTGLPGISLVTNI